MMTQTHLLLGAALFARPGQNRRNATILIGTLVPDLAIYVLFTWASVTGIDQETLWRETYWSEPWSTWTTIGNSFPLYFALLLVALMLIAPKDGRPRWQSLPALFALAALIHLLGDFPLHASDAHRHFWPISEWRFNSPISYWEPDHYGGIFAPIESIFGIGLAVLLWRRFSHRLVRGCLFILLLAYLAVPVFFVLQLG